MERTRLPSRAALVTLAALAPALLVGCGQTSDGKAGDSSSSSSSSSSSASSAADLSTKPWLMTFESYSGEDGETKQATYVSIVPATGATTVVKMPTVPVTEVSADGRSLLVDAGHRWALVDNRPPAAERDAGTVTLRDLTAGGKPTVLDVRKSSGDASLRTGWVSFDPTIPSKLRVVSGQQVWTVDVTSGEAKQESALPTHPDWIYGGGFDKNTGLPYIEDIASFDTRPAGNGDDDERPIARAGGTLTVPGIDKPFGDLPDPGCEAGSGYVAGDGAAWAFCVVAKHVEVKKLVKDASVWEPVGKPTGDVAPGDGDPVFALPQTPAA